MTKKKKMPTLEQLHEGFELECKATGDPDLDAVAATKVKLQLVEDPSCSDARFSHERSREWFLRERNLRGLIDGEKPPVPDQLAEPSIKFDIEVLAVPSEREHWVRCGSWAEELTTHWRELDASLLTAYLARLILALGLEDRMAEGS